MNYRHIQIEKREDGYGYIVGESYLNSIIQKEKMIGSNVKVLETMRISNSKYIQILKIGNKCFAIAVCKDTVTYLCEVNEEELIYRENSTGGIHVDNFKAILDKYKKDKPED